MITKEALEFITNHSAARPIRDRVGNEIALALPKDLAIHDLERFYPRRFRFRGTFSTSSLQAFVRYVIDKTSPENVEGAAAAPCLVDAERMSAAAIFNLGTDASPGHGDDRALLTMKRTAGFDAVLALSGKPIAQQAFVDWLEDWLPHIGFIGADGMSCSNAKAIAAVRAVTIDAKRTSEHKVDAMAASRSTFERVEANSREGLPHWLDFSCEPYSGLEERTMRIRLSIRTSGDAPTFVPTLVGAEALSESLAQELVKLLEDRFAGEAVNPLVGSFALGA
jgi:uncharacterized protein YfdQ (DUF2303 family)